MMNLDERVQEERWTQEQADLMLERMMDNKLSCDGTGNTGNQAMRGRAGSGMARGQGMGNGVGMFR